MSDIEKIVAICNKYGIVSKKHITQVMQDARDWKYTPEQIAEMEQVERAKCVANCLEDYFKDKSISKPKWSVYEETVAKDLHAWDGIEMTEARIKAKTIMNKAADVEDWFDHKDTTVTAPPMFSRAIKQRLTEIGLVDKADQIITPFWDALPNTMKEGLKAAGSVPANILAGLDSFLSAKGFDEIVKAERYDGRTGEHKDLYHVENVADTDERKCVQYFIDNFGLSDYDAISILADVNNMVAPLETTDPYYLTRRNDMNIVSYPVLVQVSKRILDGTLKSNLPTEWDFVNAYLSKCQSKGIDPGLLNVISILAGVKSPKNLHCEAWRDYYLQINEYLDKNSNLDIKCTTQDFSTSQILVLIDGIESSQYESFVQGKFNVQDVIKQIQNPGLLYGIGVVKTEVPEYNGDISQLYAIYDKYAYSNCLQNFVGFVVSCVTLDYMSAAQYLVGCKVRNYMLEVGNILLFKDIAGLKMDSLHDKLLRVDYGSRHTELCFLYLPIDKYARKMGWELYIEVL